MMGRHGPGSASPDTPGGGGPAGRAGSGLGFDMARHFIEEMIPHHQDAVEMADLALARAEHPELRELAASIKSVQAAAKRR